MRNLRISSALIAAAFLFGGALSAQDKNTKGKEGPAPQGSGSTVPACCQQMMKGEMAMMPGMRGMQGMMQGMTPEAMERMMLLMRVPIFLDAPCPIFAQAEKLGLSEEQKKQLVQIENEARQKARAILTPDQVNKLGNVPDKPATMRDTCPMMKMMDDQAK